MKHKYSCYEYEIMPTEVTISSTSEHEEYKTGYYYKIYGEGCHPTVKGVIDSDEWYETEGDAVFYAEKHIDELENGSDYEGNHEELMAIKRR